MPPGGPGNLIAKDLEEAFQRLVMNAVTLGGARVGSLALLSPATKKLTPLATFCLEGPMPSQREFATMARWVAGRKGPAIIDQSATNPHMRVPDIPSTGSMACAPLLSGQEMLGILMLSSPRSGAFHRSHMKLLETLADLAAAAVLQARQQEAASRQLHALTTVVEVGRALSNTSDIRQVLSLTTAGIRRLIPCEEAVLFSYEDPSGELRGVAGLGTQSIRLAEQRIRIDDTHSVTAWVARQRRPLLHSSGSRAFVGRITDTLLTRADLALLAVPLVAQEQLLGVITLARPAPFDVNDLRTMMNLGSFVAPALAQANRAEAEG
jgi:GAF domain-containing protein